MKRFILVLILLLSVSGLFGENKTIYENTRGLSYLHFYEDENGCYFIYAEELKDTECFNIINIMSYDKQKLSDIVVYFLDHKGMKRNFLNNLEELGMTPDSKETVFYNSYPKIKIFYSYFVE